MVWSRVSVRLLAGLIALLLGACVASPVQETGDAAPPYRPDLGSVADAVSRAEEPSRGGNKSPYTVLGNTYHILPTAVGYRERGIASWYGNKFHGRLTSNGEVYDAYEMTAAHRSLPLPTYVRVTNLDNGRRVIVRVNDRGPFHQDRLIDLSYAAAYKLGFHELGTSRVEVEALSTADDGRVLATTGHERRSDAPENLGTLLQVGAFRSLEGAQRLRGTLSFLLDESVFIDTLRKQGVDWYRVRIGPIFDLSNVGALQRRVSDAKLGTPMVVSQ